MTVLSGIAAPLLAFEGRSGRRAQGNNYGGN